MENKLTKIKERVLYLIELHNNTKESFFEQIGMTYGNFKGDAKNRPLNSDAVANILSIYSDVNAHWLLTGEGSMLKSEEKPLLKEEKLAIPTDNPVGIPLIGLEVAAGFGSADFAIHESDIQNRYLVPDFVDIDYMVRVKGDSMIPKYSAGDIIACRIIRESKFIQWNKCYIIGTTEQGLLVKRVKKGANDDSLLLISENKDYDPFEIPVSEITGMALVVGVIRME